MKKILFIIILAGAAIGGLLLFIRGGGVAIRPQADGLKKMYVIGVVRTPPTLDGIWESFRTKMKSLGYEEGKNVTYNVIEVGGDYQETKKRVALLIDQHVDIVYPLGGLATHAAKDITDERNITLPIVFGITADPVKAGLVHDLKSSGNNVTGVLSANETISSKRLELLLEAVPAIKRIVFAWNDPVTTGIETFRQTAKTLGVQLAEKKVANAEELDAFLATFAFKQGDALFRASDTISATRVQAMVKLALEKKIPFSGTSAFDAEKGAFMSYGANFQKMGEQGAILVDQILSKGKSPSDLPIELPSEFDLIVNLKTAKILGIDVAPAFLLKANRLIQ